MFHNLKVEGSEEASKETAASVQAFVHYNLL